MVKCITCGEEFDPTISEIEVYVQGKRFIARNLVDLDFILKYFSTNSNRLK